MSEFPVQQENKRKDMRNNIIVIALSVILVIVLILFFIQRKEHHQIVGDLVAKKDSIQTELTHMVANYDSLKTENDTINEKLLIAQTHVRDLLIEVEQTKKISVEKITEYQNSIVTLRGIMRNYFLQVDSLNERNKLLMAENTKVKEQAKQVEMKNEQLTQANQELQQNKKTGSHA